MPIGHRSWLPWIIDNSVLCASRIYIYVYVYSFRRFPARCTTAFVSRGVYLSDARTVSNSVEFSLEASGPSLSIRPRIGRVRVVQRLCGTVATLEEFRRLRLSPPPKQELHAYYPFILENPCRSEALGNTLRIPIPAQDTTGQPHIWGCLAYLVAFTCTRLSHIFHPFPSD